MSRIAALLGLVLTGWGCQQPPTYFYYGYGAPPCVPVVPAPAPRPGGNVGEPASEIIEGGATTGDATNRTTTVVGSEAPPRVVVSEPDYQPRGSWRRNPNPNQTFDTSVEGAVRTTNSGDPGGAQ